MKTQRGPSSTDSDKTIISNTERDILYANAKKFIKSSNSMGHYIWKTQKRIVSSNSEKAIIFATTKRVIVYSNVERGIAS